MTPLRSIRLLGRLTGVAAPAFPENWRLEDEISRLRPADWVALIRTAHGHLLAPALFAGLAKRDLLYAVPDDVRDYLGEMARLNALRNARLADMLAETLGVLNGAGIVPCAVKGAVHLLEGHDERMMSDIDLLVAPRECPAAAEALRAAGFAELRAFSATAHAVADYGRPQDVGALDLHRAPLALPHDAEPAVRALLHDWLEAALATSRTEWRGRAVRVPSPEARIVHLAAHDQLQDRHFYAGRLNLRHLRDTARLLADLPPARRDRLAGQVPAPLRTMMQVQLLAAAKLFGGPAAPSQGAGRAARFAWRRSLVQLALPALGSANRLAGLLAWHLSSLRLDPAEPLRRPGWRLRRLLGSAFRRGALFRARAAWQSF